MEKIHRRTGATRLTLNISTPPGSSRIASPPPRFPIPTMSNGIGPKGAGDHFLAHPIQQRERCRFATCTEHFAEGGFQSRFRDDIRLDAGGEPLGPSLAMAFGRRQPLFFPDQGVDIAAGMFHTRLTLCNCSPL